MLLLFLAMILALLTLSNDGAQVAGLVKPRGRTGFEVQVPEHTYLATDIQFLGASQGSVEIFSTTVLWI